MKKSEIIEILNKLGDEGDISVDTLFKAQSIPAPNPQPIPAPNPQPIPRPIQSDTQVVMTAAEFLQLIDKIKGSPKVEKPDNGGDNDDEIYF